MYISGLNRLKGQTDGQKAAAHKTSRMSAAFKECGVMQDGQGKDCLDNKG